ncbi:hypothetical protein WMC41_07060 [Shinella yambaruensis]|uniref:hypothetical protein n=1 Tax=Shinella yambaruensis TaxID=415996 RepID=UPI003D7A7513
MIIEANARERGGPNVPLPPAKAHSAGLASPYVRRSVAGAAGVRLCRMDFAGKSVSRRLFLQKAKKNKAESLVLQVSRDLYPLCGGSVYARQRSDPPKT